MRIIEKHEIDKLVVVLVRIRKRYVTPFKPSTLFPPYLFWNRSGSEQSKMYPTMYVTPALLEEAQKIANAETTL